MKISLKIVLGVAVLAALGFVGSTVALNGHLPTEGERTDTFITANPLNLSQIRGFSQYRSCEGHDFRFLNLDGEMEKTPRSMKHYITVNPEYRGTVGVVDVYAPFDGEVFAVEDDRGGPGDQQIWLTPDVESVRKWHVVLFHIALDEGIEEGAPVRAGQHIGTANLKRGPEGGTDNFDIAAKFTRPLRTPLVAPPFNYAAESVLQEYRTYGITPDELIISEEYRDANPCPIVSGSNPKEPFFPPGAASDEYVMLSR